MQFHNRGIDRFLFPPLRILVRLPGLRCRFGAFFQRHESERAGHGLRRDQDPTPGLLEAQIAHLLQQGEGLVPVGVDEERHTLGLVAQEIAGLVLVEPGNPFPAAIGAVRHHQIVGLKRKIADGFARRRIRQLKGLTGQIKQAQTLMDPPIRAGTARFAHHGGIHTPDVIGRQPGRAFKAQPGRMLLGDQLQTHPAKPGLSLP